MIAQKIVERVTTLYELKQPIIIAICGAADLGKSYLSKEIVRLLNKRSISSSHLTPDAYLLDREERKRKGLSGYQVESHDIEMIQSDVEKWFENKEINYRPYGHKLGEKEKHYKSINSTDVLLIEGLFSMDKLLIPFIDFSIFIFTSDERLRAIKYEADLVKRNYSNAYSEEIYDKELDLYKRNIEPFKTIADCRLLLENKWNYVIQEKGK